MCEHERQILSDAMDPARSAALMAALGRKERPKAGDPLPPFFHHLYFWDPQPPEKLGRDGHPRTGAGLIPDPGLPRRMWAGGRLRFDAPVRLGVPAQKSAHLVTLTRKHGRSGPLVFATLRHVVTQNGIACLSEDQDIVYREDPAPGTPAPRPPRAPDTAETGETRAFDTTLLFRYSALTFNGHRIHYDLAYATGVEGYPGLVVHGPLLAQCLMLLAEDRLGKLGAFDFRATAPLFHTETATLACHGTGFWAAGPDTRLCMRATATPAPTGPASGASRRWGER